MEKKEIEGLLLQHRIREALANMKPMIGQCDKVQLSNQFATLEQNYTYMLSFLSRGGKDENRASMQLAIVSKALLLLDTLQRQLRLEKGTDLYSQTYRICYKQSPNEKLDQYLDEWNKQGNTTRFQKEDTLFLALWTSDFFDDDQEKRFTGFLENKKSTQRQYFLTALFLSCWEYFDPHKYAIICHQIVKENSEDSYLTGHLAVLYALLCTKYQNKIPYFPQLHIECPPNISRHFYKIERQLLLNRQGGLIRKYLAGEIMPQMKRQLDRYQSNKLEFEETDEWDEMNEQFSERLKELVKDGVDLNMDAMAQGLHHPFFSIICHWFLPFDKERPEVAPYLHKEADGKPSLKEILIMFQSCDTDRYAMALMMKQIPTIPAGLENQVDDMRAMINDKNAIAREPIRDILRSMYRFFCFSIWKKEFDNPFETRKSLLDNPLLNKYFLKEEILSYCKLAMRYYAEEDAYNHIESLILMDGANAEILRMRGICKQKKEHYASAIDDFAQADLLEEDEDTLDRLQKCLRLTERYSEQEDCLYRLQKISPQKDRYTSDLAKCLMMQKKYEDALKIFYRMEYEGHSPEKAMRGIIWCSLKLNKLENATKYDKKLLSPDFSISWEDYLNAGHVAWLGGSWNEAALRYEQFMQSYLLKFPKNTAEQAIHAFDEDCQELLLQHICQSDIQLMRDIILSKFIPT